jgi:hypothetical protein
VDLREENPMDGTSWIHLAQYMDQLHVLMNILMKIRAYKMLGIS